MRFGDPRSERSGGGRAVGAAAAGVPRLFAPRSSTGSVAPHPEHEAEKKRQFDKEKIPDRPLGQGAFELSTSQPFYLRAPAKSDHYDLEAFARASSGAGAHPSDLLSLVHKIAPVEMHGRRKAALDPMALEAKYRRLPSLPVPNFAAPHFAAPPTRVPALPLAAAAAPLTSRPGSRWDAAPAAAAVVAPKAVASSGFASMSTTDETLREKKKNKRSRSADDESSSSSSSSSTSSDSSSSDSEHARRRHKKHKRRHHHKDKERKSSKHEHKRSKRKLAASEPEPSTALSLDQLRQQRLVREHGEKQKQAALLKVPEW